MTPREHTPDIDPRALREAADWLTRLHGEDVSPAKWAEMEGWRTACPMHARAWQRAEHLLGSLRDLPAAPARAALERPDPRRRQMLRMALLPALPAGWLAWQHATTDGERWHTAAGEQRDVTLADGTQLLLNTATDIRVRFDAATRLIQLRRGEILVTSAPDILAVPRPLVVATADGTARPIGTRFSARRAEGDTFSEVAVFEGEVEIESRGRHSRIGGGQRVRFGPHGPDTPVTLDAVRDAAWINGMIVAHSMRLADLVAELGRYRPGVLRCHPGVADLRVSGTFPALEPERSLKLLAASFPLQVRQRTRYWVTLEAA